VLTAYLERWMMSNFTSRVQGCVQHLKGDLQQDMRVLGIPTERNYEACFAASTLRCSAQT